MLEQGGELLHALALEGLAIEEAVAPDLFKFTPKETEVLAQSVSRLAARYAVVERVAKASDETVVALTLGKYVLRNAVEARGAIALTEAQLPPEPREEVDRGVSREAGEVARLHGEPPGDAGGAAEAR